MLVEFPTIRSIVPNDSSAIIELAVAAGLFPATETAMLDRVLKDYFDGNLGEGHRWVTDEEDGEIRGVAYYAPDLVGDRVWYIYMIAVQPHYQGKGRGTALMQYVENELRSNDGRLLLVETSGLPKYDRTRQFYAKCGYEEEARIRDFYGTSDDKILFRKVL
jgi:ribosomal protein S18 acetylase RimI-like enzyme